MDRNIVYPGAIPLDTDILTINRNTLIALGYLVQATLGSNTVVDGLACAPTSPASMSVTVGPGSITTLTTIDPLAYGALPADNTDPLVKMGINTTPTSFTLTAPTSSGESIAYLIEASFLESDTDPVILPYYNAANPAQPYSGPSNSGAAQNTARIERVQLQVKSGAPAPTGTQTTPPVDSGWFGLYVITVAYGATSITAANIETLATAPFIPFKLPALTPGVSRMTAFGQSGTWTVPSGISQVRARLWGAGGGAGGGGSGAGGSGGGYAEGYFPVTPGTTIAITVGAGGTSGLAGGTTSFGTFASATGGAPGGSGSANGAGVAAANGGTGSGGSLGISGQFGQNGLVFPGGGLVGGSGGAAFGGGGAFGPAGSSSTSLPGLDGAFAGAGASGGIADGAGGTGANGLVILEW
ncbi:glycine-rich domain-containing protein [Acidibrevibacterium fodinaquatile]|uniref:glycine-rich domain-containing protein n=1 Tax=Acidibrevibacterium fodinaquatile TaxID=1969806 RepID=UPI000E0DBA7C|nr:hypothetical protein [Acidibrevibacterium fodinaquatile]